VCACAIFLSLSLANTTQYPSHGQHLLNTKVSRRNEEQRRATELLLKEKQLEQVW
jgi:hypothetical protein